MGSDDLNEDVDDYVVVTGSDTEERLGPGEKPAVVAKIKEWLSPTEFDSDTSEYKKHLNSHVRGTGQWILATDQYKRWYETDEIGDLWIRGIPGSGKSVVAASLIRDLKHRGDAPVLFFFFRHIIMSNRTPQSLLRDCSFQLLDHSHSLQSSLRKVMKAHSNINEAPIDELWKCFSSALSGINKIYCVVDALDEMESGHDSFLADLLNLGRRNPKSVKLALTSRQLAHLEVHLKGSCLVDLRLDRKNVDKDIATYISHRLKHCRVDLSEAQSRGIEEAICDKGKGLFLYARLMMDQCLQDPTEFVSQLDKLPDGLGNMYTDLLHEHATRSGTTEDFQRLVLGWVTHSTRPLRLLELTAAVNSLPDRGGLESGQETKMCIRTCCGPLLELCEDQVIQIIHHSFTEFLLDPDIHHIQISSTDSVRFPVLNPTEVHKMIAFTCVNYLRSGCFEQWIVFERNDALFERDDEPRSKKELWGDHGGVRYTQKHKELMLRFHFLDYAAQYWSSHAEKVTTPDTELFEQLDGFTNDKSHDFESWKDFWNGMSTSIPDNLSPLHVAAHCGLAAYTEYLLIQGADPNLADSYQRTPTTYAAMEGHARALKFLIEHNALFDNPDARGLAPIQHAAKRNQSAALRVLLEAGADPLIGKAKEEPYFDPEYRNSTIGETALLYACQYGHVAALNELLKHLDPSQLLAGPLHWAADRGRAEILLVLLQHEEVRIHINDIDAEGNTPLYLAARARDPASVRVLIEHKADVNARSEDKEIMRRGRRMRREILPRIQKPKLGYTAIHALMHLNGHCGLPQSSVAEIKEILDLLIGAGADINARDEIGRTALFAWNEERFNNRDRGAEIISIFLTHGADATATDMDGSTLLHRLTGHISEKNAVRLLVDAGVSINAVTKIDGETPLITATRRNQLMDPTLFHEFDADFDRKDLKGNTALHWACDSWCMEDKHADIWLSLADPTILNNARRPAASNFAWGNGGQGRVDALPKMVKLGLSLESRDYLGRTLLLQFLGGDYIQGCEHFIKMLLSLGADVKSTDYQGKSVLHLLAASQLSNNDHGKVDLEKYTQFMQVLIEAGADLHAVDHGGNTIFHDAIGWNDSIWSSWPTIRSGVKAMVNLGVPIKALNHRGRTALHIAAALEDRGVSREINEIFTSRLDFCLQKDLGLDVNARDHERVTPLHLAAATCEVNVWKLIQAGADVQARTIHGRTALHLAAAAGKCNIVDLIVRHYISQSASLDSPDLKGRTALHEAARAGRPESVKILLAAGASAKVQDKRGRNPLHAAAEYEEVPAARITQRKHDAKDPLAGGGRKYAFHEEPKKGFEEMQVMISRKNDPKCVRQVVWLLLNAGTDPAQLDANEHTASDVAVMLGNRAVVEAFPSEIATLHPFDGATLKPLDPVGQMLLSFQPGRHAIQNMDFGDDSFQFLERLISHGSPLVEGVVAANSPLQSLVKADGSSPLHLIARSGLTGMMEMMLPYVKDVNAFKPPLLNAALKRPIWNMEMVKLLIRDGVDVNAQYLKPPSKRDSTRYSQDSHQYAAVHVLATGKYWWYPEALQELLKAGANPEFLNDNGETALQVALAARSPESHTQGFWCDQTLDVLLDHGANVNIVASETSLTPLNTALESHCGPQITQKLLDHGADGSFGPKPAIASAIDSLDYASLEILLKAGANPNEVYMSNERKRYEDGPKLETALQNAACPTRTYDYDPYADAERSAVISLLLEHGADPSQPLMDGTTTVLHEIAAINGLLKPILVDGVDLEQKDSVGRTPLMRSCSLPDSYKRAIETEYASLELISAGASINTIDSTGSTALHYAIKSDLPLTISKLLTNGALVNIKDNTGTTPLYYALKSFSFQDITALLDAGANPLDLAPDGRTPLHFLVPHLIQHSAQHPKDRKLDYPDEFIEYKKLYTRCIEAGCSREARDNAGSTPIFAYVASVKQYDEMECEPAPSLTDFKAMFADHDVFAVNGEGETLLHVVAGREENFRHQGDGLELFKCLVEMGLDPSKENARGASAVDVAAACGNEGILGLFARDE